MREDPELAILLGTLDVLVLETLSRGPSHGYGIARWIRESSGNAFRVLDGALYTALHRLEEPGWVESEGGTPSRESARSATASRTPAAGRCASRPRSGSATPREWPAC